MTRWPTVRQVRREARGDLPLLAVLGVVTALFAAVCALAPVLLARQEDQALRQRLAAAQSRAPALTVTADLLGAPAGKATPVATALRQAGHDLVADADGPLAHTLRLTRGRADYPAASVAVPAGVQPGTGSVMLTVSYVSDAAAHLRIASGHSPGPGAAPELMLSRTTARQLGLRAGDRLTAVYRRGGRSYPVTFLLAGVFDPVGTGDDFWQGQAALDRPLRYGLAGSPGLQLSARALIGAAAPEQLEQAGVPDPGLTWELGVRLGRAAVAQARALPAALARYPDGVSQGQCGGADAGGTPVCTAADRATTTFDTTDRLTGLLGDFDAADARARTLLSFAAAAVAAVGGATLVTSVRLLLRRQAAALRLQQVRGASVGQLVAMRCATGLPVIAAATAAGWAAGVLGAPSGGSGRPQLPAALGCAAAAALALAVQTWLTLREPATAYAARARLPRRGRRLVGETLVLLAAVAGVVVLRLEGTAQGPDPQTAATPVLVAVVTVLVLLRIHPPLLAFAAARARGGRGFLGLVSLARARAEVPATSLALFVLVLSLGTAVLGGLVTRTVDRGVATAAAWSSGGDAAAVTDGTTDPAAVRVPGVRAVTEQLRRLDLTGPDGSTHAGTAVLGVDVAALRAAAPGGPLAAALTGAAGPLAGDGLPAGTYRTNGGVPLTAARVLTPAELRDPLLGPLLSELPSGTPLLVTPQAGRPDAQGTQGTPDLGSTAVLLFAEPGSGTARLRTAADQALGPLARLQVRGELAAALRADGLVHAIRAGYVAAGVLAVVLALLTLALELVLTAPARGRTAALLRTLGVGGGGVAAVQLLQLLPLALVAACGGVLLGVVEPALLGPALSVRPFTGGPGEPARALDDRLTAALGLGLGLLVLAEAAVEALSARRRALAAVLRLGDA